MSRTSGFRPLKPGHIHMRCPRCGRKQSNGLRHPEFDHPTAFLVEDECEKCGAGNFTVPVYYDRRGRPLSGDSERWRKHADPA